MDQQIYVTLQFFAVEYISVDNVFYLVLFGADLHQTQRTCAAPFNGTI